MEHEILVVSMIETSDFDAERIDGVRFEGAGHGAAITTIRLTVSVPTPTGVPSI